MIWSIVSILLIIFWLFSKNPQVGVLIASGIFAIAGELTWLEDIYNKKQ